MGRFVRGKDLRASTVKSPNTLGDIQGGAILADTITSIGDITVIAGNVTADVITGNSFVGVTASPAGSPNDVQYNNAGSLGGSANFTYDGTYGLTVQEDITSVGNVNGGNLVATQDVTTYTVTATGNITGDNLLTGGLVSATGNVTGGNVIASNLTSGRIVIATTSGHLTDDSNFTWDGTTFTTGNISAGAISVTSIDALFGNITTIGNIQGGNLISDGIVSVVGNINGANLIATEAVSAGSTVDAVGNVTGGNVVAATAVIATLGNVEGVNLVTSGVVDATGNVTGGNLITSGLVSATGNVTGGNLISSADTTVGAKLNVTGSGGYGIIIQNNQSVSWYDSTDTYLTQLEATDATATRTIALPDASGTVALTSDLANITPTTVTATGNISTGGILSVDVGTHEQFSSLSSATGTVTHDCSNGHIFYHTSPSADFTANFTNLNLGNTYATTTTLVVIQGATARIANAVQIGGSSETINWQGGSEPTGTNNGIDVITFSVLNNAGTYTVLGQLVDF